MFASFFATVQAFSKKKKKFIKSCSVIQWFNRSWQYLEGFHSAEGGKGVCDHVNKNPASILRLRKSQYFKKTNKIAKESTITADSLCGSFTWLYWENSQHPGTKYYATFLAWSHYHPHFCAQAMEKSVRAGEVCCPSSCGPVGGTGLLALKLPPSLSWG